MSTTFFEFMASEKMKEAREWSTFIVTVLTGIGLPLFYFLIAITLKNQRLEIQADAKDRFVHKEDFNIVQHTWDTSLGEVRGSLNAIIIQQTHQSDAIENLKEKIDSSNHR